MKKLILLFSFCCPLIISANITCSCGSFASGVYEYDVQEGSGCCSGEPSGYGESGNAHFISYERNDGAWQITDVREVSPINAQTQCCEPIV